MLNTSATTHVHVNSPYYHIQFAPLTFPANTLMLIPRAQPIDVLSRGIRCPVHEAVAGCQVPPLNMVF